MFQLEGKLIYVVVLFTQTKYSVLITMVIFTDNKNQDFSNQQFPKISLHTEIIPATDEKNTNNKLIVQESNKDKVIRILITGY